MQRRVRLFSILTLTGALLAGFYAFKPGNGSDNPYPQDYFINPIGIPLSVSGSFGELRSNHFHAGLDLRTNNQIGYRVYAVADGWVSRVKISPFGYGKAVYVTHPNGYTSVYGHLSKIKGPVAQYVLAEQYSREKFDVDLSFKKNQFPVKQGDTIALTGNSGGSTAPHLHFEIRDSRERPMNPLLFGYKIPDSIAPLIQNIAIFDVDHPHQPIRMTPRKSGNTFQLSKDTIKVPFTNVGFGIKVYDKMNGSDSQNGIYTVEVFRDKDLLYGFDVKRIGFDESRYINCHIDYAGKMKGEGTYQKCYVEDGNRLSGYKEMRTRGVIRALDRSLGHEITIHVKDFSGNHVTSKFYLKYKADPSYQPKTQDYTKIMPYEHKNTFLNDQVYIDFAPNTFYDTLYFRYDSTISTGSNIYSPMHHIHDSYEPVHKNFKVLIKPQDLPKHLRSKALVAYQDHRGRINSRGGKWQDDYLMARTKNLGTYFITTDTIKPTIKPYNFFDGKNLKSGDKLQVVVDDNLSDVKYYRGTIDGKWILMDYDAKNNMLTYLFDDRFPEGAHEFKLVISDGRQNSAVYKATIKR